MNSIGTRKGYGILLAKDIMMPGALFSVSRGRNQPIPTLSESEEVNRLEKGFLRMSYNGSTSAFQAESEGSIPFIRSNFGYRHDLGHGGISFLEVRNE